MNKKTHNRKVRDSRWVALGARLARMPKGMRVLAVLTLGLGFAYLVWRLIFTWQGASPTLFWALWIAEFIGWLSLALFVRDAWSREESLPVGPVSGSVAILIPTYDEELEILEPTLEGALAVKECDSIWLLDDGNRSWVRDLAAAKGVNYLARKTHEHAKAGNLNNAIRQLSDEFILVLDADHIPNQDIVTKLKPYFVDPKVAVVQSPHGFRNLDSAQHYDRKIHEQSLFFEILLPGRNSRDAVFWCGSGALLRLSALKSVGGVQTSTITEDLETSLALQRAGHKSVFHNEILLQGLAPANLSAYLLQRYRWARGTFEVLTSKKSPIFGRGHKFKTRLSYFSNFVYYLVPLQHIAFVLVLTTSLLTGQLPVRLSTIALLGLWLPQLLLSLVVGLGLSEGRQLPFSGSSNAWTTSAIYLEAILDRLLGRKATFKVTPKDGIEEAGVANLRLLWLPIVAGVLLVIAIAGRLIDNLIPQKFLAPMDLTGSTLAILFAAYELSVILPLLIKAYSTTQVRKNWRYEVNLAGEVEGTAVQIRDLNLTGLRFELKPNFVATWLTLERAPISIELSNGAIARGEIKIRTRYLDPATGTVFVGAAVDWADAESRSEVIREVYMGPIEPELT